MSNYNKILAVTILVISSLTGQTLLNGYGLGLKNNDYDSASLGISSSGIVPSFGKDVALQNPSTWHNLGFTYFTGTYRSNFRKVLNSIVNEQSALSNAQFIIPIKNKYSFGFGVAPYLNQYLKLENNKSTNFISFGDTLEISNSSSTFGGITEFKFSVGGEIYKYLNAAIQFSALYGSARQQVIFSLDELNYYSQKRSLFSGSLTKFFINSDVLSNFNVPVNLYLSYGLPLKSISVTSNNYRPFEDSNGSGAQDIYDFPSSLNVSDPIESNEDNVSSPYEFQLGFDYQLNQNINILGEFSNWFDQSKKGAEYSSLNEQIKSVKQYNIAIAKFAPEIVKNPMDRFNFKLGAYSKNIELLNTEKLIKEYGVSTGVSFNFGIPNNQIDFAYSIGKRKDLIGVGDENIQKFSIGITVGDIWFVKRRSQ